MTTPNPSPSIKRMRLRYTGTCARCRTRLDAGVTADYDRTSKTVSCVECPTEPTVPTDAAPSPAQPVSPATPLQPDSPATPPHLAVVDGDAGGSAQREFERRHAAREARVRERFPRAGGFLLAVFDDPQSTRAWTGGSEGEQQLGASLARVAGPELRVLNDRRIPKTRANIDHLVICPAGVFLVDAKRYQNARPEKRVEGGILRPRRELLVVRGRDRTALAEGVAKQVGLVRAALTDHPDVPVHGVLCFIDADWPLIGAGFFVLDVAVLSPRRLRKQLTEPGRLDAERVADLQWQLHLAFPRQPSG